MRSDRREARPEQRREELSSCKKHCRPCLRKAGNADTASDVLDHDNDVIDQQTDRRGDAAQRITSGRPGYDLPLT